MRTPIIAIESHGEAHVFGSIEEAESYIEPIDAKEGEYVIYDAEGLVLVAHVEQSKGFLAPEKVRISESSEKNAEALRTSLFNYLNRVDIQHITEETPLAELVRLLQQFS